LTGLDRNNLKYLLNGPAIDEAAPHVLNISFPGLKGETIIHCLEADGVYVSTGAACSSKDNQVSHVLLASGLSQQEAEGSVRISFSHFNSSNDIDEFVEAMVRAYQRLSPHN